MGSFKQVTTGGKIAFIEIKSTSANSIFVQEVTMEADILYQMFIAFLALGPKYFDKMRSKT